MKIRPSLHTFTAHGLEILKRSVLLLLYEETEIAYEKSPYGPGRTLKPSDLSEKLGISPPRVTSSDSHAVFYGILDHLREDGLAYHYLHVGWCITEKGVSIIEDQLSS